jgi:hypothetical protein
MQKLLRHFWVKNSNSSTNFSLCNKTSKYSVENHCSIWNAVKYIFHNQKYFIFHCLKLVYKTKSKRRNKLNLRTESIEISHIDQTYCFIDLLSMRMTALKHTFLYEFGRVDIYNSCPNNVVYSSYTCICGQCINGRKNTLKNPL